MAGDLQGRTIAVYGSGGAPYHHLAFAALHGASARIVRAEDIHAGALDEVDVLVMPGGGLQAMHGLLKPLGLEGTRKIRAWVDTGGTYLSSCAGSFLPLSLEGAARELHPEAEPLRMVSARLANPGDATLGGLSSPGVGTIKVRVAEGHALRDGVETALEVVHYNGPFFALSDEDESVQPFAWPVAATQGFTPAEQFMPSQVAADGTTFDQCVLKGSAMAIQARVGDGQALLFGSHPEFGMGRLQMGWGPASRLLLNAMRQSPTGDAPAAGSAGSTQAQQVGPAKAEHEFGSATPAELATRTSETFHEVVEAFAGLERTVPEHWLLDGIAPSFAGTPARQAWTADVAEARELAKLVAEELQRIAGQLTKEELGLLDDRPRANQDVGAMGLYQMGQTILAGVREASAQAQQEARTPAHAYDGLLDHPFHLAVGTYLSAAGLTASAFLVTAVLTDRHGGVPEEMRAHLFLDGARKVVS